ncbi:metal ion binding [Ascochyta rabiei]|uniref:Metal ion binding n=1 Tax=Didymella rabiei TaxID=5454 RepID=A0A163GIR8_DIDRA|nr:metal ion binding [Ascochyta rabiei]
MEDYVDIPEESRRHIEALLARHHPQMIQRMFSQTLESRRNSVSSLASTNTTATSSTSSSGSSWRSRLSIASTFSTSTGSSDAASVASSASSRFKLRGAGPRSYPVGLDPTRPVPAMLTPASDVSSPLDSQLEHGVTPTDDISIASDILFPDEKGQSQSGESYMFCTYCAEQKSLKTFKAKSDWKKHEMRMHETGEDWGCVVIGCSRIFDRQKDFIKHHQRYHSGRPLPSLTDIGITLLPRRVFGCGFDKCKEVSIGWDDRCDHVAKHMKNGATSEQWRYSNVLRNLIRQEALHETWKEIVACLDERLKENRAQISWCPDNTRVLRQKLQCCDLRPSREEVLITALSLRSDIVVDAVHQQLPTGFVTPSRDSVPHVDRLTREQRMQILIGHSNVQLSRTRLAGLNAALLGVTTHTPNYHCGSSPFAEPNSPTIDTTERRISYMDIDPGDYLDVAQPPIPDLHLSMSAPQIHTPVTDNGQSLQQQPANYIDQNKSSPNPLGWYYPNYFDVAPQFEESQYYDRPSLGQMIAKPLHKIGNRLSPSRNSSRPTSHVEQSHADIDFGIQNPVAALSMRNMHAHIQPQQHMQSSQHYQQQHAQQQPQQQQQQQQQPIVHPQPQHFRNPAQMQGQLHLFTTHN